jgi:rubrerythrin
VRFDIETYKRRTARLDDDDVDYDVFREQPLDESTMRCLRYMHDVELHTVCYLRDLLVTRAHNDPDITTFLTFWAYEEYWHGEAIAKVLQAHGEPAGRVRVAATRARHRVANAISPHVSALFSAVTSHFTAVHITWGAVNEWTTQAGYTRLAARAKNPVLSQLLERIMRQEGRHIDFYASEASRRLEVSPAAQRLTRFALRKLWAPVGSGVMPRTEVAYLVDHLFADEDGRAMAARIDRRIDRLPGLADLGLVSGAVDRWRIAA